MYFIWWTPIYIYYSKSNNVICIYSMSVTREKLSIHELHLKNGSCMYIYTENNNQYSPTFDSELLRLNLH